MYILMRIVFIICVWSPKLLTLCQVSGSVQNYSCWNQESKSAILKETSLKSCLQKCCPCGQIYSVSKRHCSPEEQISTLTTKWTINFPHFDILHNSSIQWQNLVILNKSRGDDYQLYKNGILHVSVPKLHEISIFCFEYISEDRQLMPFISLDNLPIVIEDEEWRFIFYACGMTLSNVFLLITLGLYISTPALHRSVKDKSFSCYVISLIFGFSFLMAAQNMHKGYAFCTVIAYMTQFWLLAGFFWLNIMCIDIWCTVNTTKLVGQSSKQKFSVYCCYAWGCPLLVSIATILSERLLTDVWRPGLGEDDCWFRKYNGDYLSDPKFLYFYSVISVTVISNFYMFSDTALIILSRNRKWKQIHPDSQRHVKKQQQRYLLNLKLFTAMGLNWILDMASYYIKTDGLDDLWFIIDMVNSLQGVFIFLLFVCNKKVIRLLEKRFFRRRTFLKEYTAYRNLNSSTKQFRTSSNSSRLSFSQKDVNSNVTCVVER